MPRSVRLAAWGTAVLRGQVTPVEAVRAVTGDDEPHLVELEPRPDALPGDPATGRVVELGELFVQLLQRGTPGLRVVLPAPGDPLGLPGPAAFNRGALETGECVLTEVGPDREPPWGLLPWITEFGSVWEPGAMVRWTATRIEPPRITVSGSLAEAERELREALAQGTSTLSRLDVARWREDAADRVAKVRDGGLPRNTLPPSAPARSVQVLSTAARVRAIVGLAREDDGAAVTGYEVEHRARTLRELDGVSRRAMTAAVNAMLEPGR